MLYFFNYSDYSLSFHCYPTTPGLTLFTLHIIVKVFLLKQKLDCVSLLLKIFQSPSSSHRIQSRVLTMLFKATFFLSWSYFWPHLPLLHYSIYSAPNTLVFSLFLELATHILSSGLCTLLFSYNFLLSESMTFFLLHLVLNCPVTTISKIICPIL